MSTDARAENEHDGAPTDPREALARYGRVYIATNNSTREVVHLHPRCDHLPPLPADGRTLTHEGQLPLRCDKVCHQCRTANTDEQGRLKPATGRGKIVDRPTIPPLQRRVCGRVDCRRDGLVRIDHPEHGTRVVCAVHQGRHPVEEVFGHDA